MNTIGKIHSLDELKEIIKQHKQNQKKVVHCHGCFDLLHIGHIRHFRQAKQWGDVLIVTITPDCFVDKGPDRPAFSEVLRSEAIASLDIVDYVAVNKWPTAESTIRLLIPDFYAKGSEFEKRNTDYTGKIRPEIEAIEEVGGKMIFTEDIVFSSTNLINRFLKHTSDDTREYFNLFRKRYNLDTVNHVIDRMAELNVLVIGDAILDDYQYCEAIGKSNKDPILALKYKSNDVFAGGVLAVANHLAGFAKSVRLASVLGQYDSYEGLIRENLHQSVTPYFIYQSGSPTTTKRRFIDGYSFNKLFEIYVMDGNGLPEEDDQRFCEEIEKEISQYDLVIAADFGHGAISEKMIQVLCNKAQFLAVNTQANAGNRGFHTISSYPCADFVCLAEHEIRLETRNLIGSIRQQMERLADELGSQVFIVTRGRSGCLVRGKRGGFVAVPSLTSQVVDRIGAGDAFFSIAAMAAALGFDEELIGFIGNVCGSLTVETIGNQKPIDALAVKKYITSLMK